MPQLFGLDIAQIVADAVASAGNIKEATLIKIIPGARTPGQLTGGTNPTTTTHAARGYFDSLSSLRPETVVKDASGVVGLLGASIAGGQVPESGDQVTIESLTFRILQVDRDPASALYVCQVN